MAVEYIPSKKNRQIYIHSLHSFFVHYLVQMQQSYTMAKELSPEEGHSSITSPRMKNKRYGTAVGSVSWLLKLEKDESVTQESLNFFQASKSEKSGGGGGEIYLQAWILPAASHECSSDL